MVSMDLFKSTEQLARERAAEKNQYRARTVTINEPEPMQMRLGGMRMPEQRQQVPARKVTIPADDASYMRGGGRMSMSPPDGDCRARTLVSPRSNAPESTGMRGGRHPLPGLGPITPSR